MYIKIDNVLGDNVLSELQYKILEGNIPWYFGESTAYKGETNPFDFSFSHLIVEDSKPVSPIFDIVLMAFMQCLDQAKQRIDTLYRMRLGLITPTSQTIVHSAHIDSDYPHMTGLFYLNSSDGDTILYNNVYDPNSGTSSLDYIKDQNLSILERFTPVENTFLSFDGYRYHSSSTPTLNKKRIVLNVNYSIIK